MRTATVIGLVLVIGLAAAVSRVVWVRYDYPVRKWSHHVATASKLARWWRCRGSDRPQLLSSVTPWSLSYSWAGGEGPGKVSLRIGANGQATVTTRPNGVDQDEVTNHHVDPNNIAGLATVVDESGLLCQTSVLRQGYHVSDLGQFKIEVTAGATHRVVTIDECHSLPDSDAFGEVANYIQSLRGQLREQVSWGPYGAAGVRGQCSE